MITIKKHDILHNTTSKIIEQSKRLYFIPKS